MSYPPLSDTVLGVVVIKSRLCLMFALKQQYGGGEKYTVHVVIDERGIAIMCLFFLRLAVRLFGTIVCHVMVCTLCGRLPPRDVGGRRDHF